VARKLSVKEGSARLLQETQELVARLVRENSALRVQNKKLAAELERISKGWDEVKRLARTAPRPRRRR